MGNNLKIMGNTFSNVSSITAHDATSGTHKYVDTSDTTAVAGDIKKNKTFYSADGVKIQGTLEVYAGAHHAVSSGYTVTVSLTDPDNPAYFTSCTIFEYANNTKGVQIGSIASPTGNTSVTVTSGSMLVEIRGSGYFLFGVHSESGGVVQDRINEDSGGADIYYVVTGDGTTTISGIDYDD